MLWTAHWRYRMKKEVNKLTLEQEDRVYKLLKRILATQDYPSHVYDNYVDPVDRGKNNKNKKRGE